MTNRMGGFETRPYTFNGYAGASYRCSMGTYSRSMGPT